MVEELLLEGDWQPIAKRRTSSAHKSLLDQGRKDLIKHGAPFNVARPMDKSNAFFAKEGKEDENSEEKVEEVSSMAGGSVEGAARKSPFINFDEEENEKTT